MVRPAKPWRYHRAADMDPVRMEQRRGGGGEGQGSLFRVSDGGLWMTAAPPGNYKRLEKEKRLATLVISRPTSKARQAWKSGVGLVRTVGV